MARDADEILAEVTAVVPGVEARATPKVDIAGVRPVVQLRPTTVDELEQVVAWACDRGLALAAVGGQTKLGVGNPPSRLDVAVDMMGLAAITEYDPDDLILSAQAGVTVQKAQSLVRHDALILPLDPQSPDKATLGGVIATADHGPRRRQYGGLRDVILGIKAVLPDGSPVAFGGRTLKNVAGYDLGQVLDRFARYHRRYHRDHLSPPTAAGP